LDHQQGIAGGSGVDTRLDTVSLGRRQNYLEDFDHVRLSHAGTFWQGHTQAQIVRANIDAIQTWHGQYLIQVLHRPGGFDHCQGDHGLVRIGVIIGSGVEAGTDWPTAAIALWRVTTRPNECLALGAAVDHWTDYAIRTCIENFHDDARFVPVHP